MTQKTKLYKVNLNLLNSGFVIPSKAAITAVIQQNGYDGVIFDNGYNPAEYVAFESEQIKLASAKKPTQSKDIRRALPKDIAARDSEYMAAIERGDIDTAQRFVDEVAKEAGYKLKVYHGTPTGGFTVFKRCPHTLRKINLMPKGINRNLQAVSGSAKEQPRPKQRACT